jgi:hypothetical protein
VYKVKSKKKAPAGTGANLIRECSLRKHTQKKSAKASASFDEKKLVEWLAKWLPLASNSSKNPHPPNRKLIEKWQTRRKRLIDWSADPTCPERLAKELAGSAAVLDVYVGILAVRSRPSISNSEADVFFMALAAVGRARDGKPQYRLVSQAIREAYQLKNESGGITARTLWKRMRPYFKNKLFRMDGKGYYRTLAKAETNLPRHLRKNIPDLRFNSSVTHLPTAT